MKLFMSSANSAFAALNIYFGVESVLSGVTNVTTTSLNFAVALLCSLTAIIIAANNN